MGLCFLLLYIYTVLHRPYTGFSQGPPHAKIAMMVSSFILFSTLLRGSLNLYYTSGLYTLLYTVHDNCTQVLTIVFVDWKPADSTYNLSVYENSILYCIYMNGFDMRKYNSGVGSTGHTVTVSALRLLGDGVCWLISGF